MSGSSPNGLIDPAKLTDGHTLSFGDQPYVGELFRVLTHTKETITLEVERGPQDERLLTRAEAAAYLDVSKDVIDRMAKTGRLKPVSATASGHRRYYSSSELDALRVLTVPPGSSARGPN